MNEEGEISKSYQEAFFEIHIPHSHPYSKIP